MPADLDGAERRGGAPRGSDCQLRGWEEGRSVHVRVNACVRAHVPTCAYMCGVGGGGCLWEPECTVLAVLPTYE